MVDTLIAPSIVTTDITATLENAFKDMPHLVSIEERLRWPHMSDKELEAAIRRDPETGEIEWAQFALAKLTEKEREAIQKSEEARWKGKEYLFDDEPPLTQRELDEADFDMRYTMLALDAKCKLRFADHWELACKARISAEVLDAAKRAFGIEKVLRIKNIEHAVRKYGLRWINH